MVSAENRTGCEICKLTIANCAIFFHHLLTTYLLLLLLQYCPQFTLVYVSIPLYFAILCGVAFFSYRRAKRMEENHENDKSMFLVFELNLLSYVYVSSMP